MQLLQRHYLSERLQKHFDNLQLPQTESPLRHENLIGALREKGAIQPTEAPEENNIFCWPLGFKGDDTDPLFLTHCDIRLFYNYKDGKWENRELCFSMGLFSTFCCKSEEPSALADEIIRIDTQLIPEWIDDFNNLSPLEMTDLAMYRFHEQCRTLRNKLIVLDSYAARVYGVSVTDVRQTISRNRDLFSDEYAFHLTWEEYQEWYKKVIGAPKVSKSDYLPYAITFEAFGLLSMHLHSTIAIKVNMGIIETVSAKVPVKELIKMASSKDDIN